MESHLFKVILASNPLIFLPKVTPTSPKLSPKVQRVVLQRSLSRFQTYLPGLSQRSNERQGELSFLEQKWNGGWWNGDPKG